MRNTQNPHIVNFEGVISYSTTTCPAPSVSAINENYKNEMKEITVSLNTITNNSVTSIEFSSLSQFSQEFAKLISETTPGEL